MERWLPFGRGSRCRAAPWIGAALALLAPAGVCRAATYYVDRSSPACSNSGAGTEAQPYCTISSAVTAHHTPGTTILVKPGTYREQVMIPASGTNGSPFTIQAIGGPVLVDGSDDFSSPGLWTEGWDDVYLASTVTWSPLQVFMDGTRLKPSPSDPGSLPESSFTWVSGEGLYVNAGGANPGDHALLVGRRNHGFTASAKSWFVITGFTISHVESRGIYLNSGCSDVVVSGDTVSFSNSYGIQAVNGLRILIEKCRTSDSQLHGIGLTAGSTACTLRANESFRNADPSVRRANGIHLYQAPGNILLGNRLYDNQDSGLHFGDLSSGCLAQNNRSWNNGDHGFDHLNCQGTTHRHDVAYGNYKDGFSIEGPSQNSTLHNCISANNGLTTNRFNLWVDDTSSTGFVSDYNLFWNSTSQAPIKIGLNIYPTLAPYQAATGDDPHSLQANPLFVNAAAGDFHLLAGSPAIDAAASDLLDWPALDADGEARMDDPGTVDTGSGPIPFADRGAFEYLAATTGVGGDPQAGSVLRSRIVPNPVRGQARLRFALAHRGSLRVELFDLTGRIVRTLMDEPDAPAGEYDLAMDLGSGGSGSLSPGLYFYRIRTPDGIARGRFALVR